MKKLILSFLCFLFFCSSTAFSQTFDWAHNLKTKAWDSKWLTYASSVVIDHGHNVLVVGSYTDTLQIDTVTYDLDDGHQNGFLAKYDSSGNLLWACNLNGGIAQSIAVDANNNIYVAGYTTWGLGIYDSFYLAENNNGFLVSFDSSGKFRWLTGTNTINSFGAAAKAVTVDRNNNVIWGGWYTDSCIFSTIRLRSGTFAQTLFIVKYTSTGTVIWAKSGAGGDVTKSQAWINGLTTDSLCNVYAVGQICADAKFDTTTIPFVGEGSNAFTAKFDSSGNIMWGLTEHGHSDYWNTIDDANSVKVDNNGNVYVCGNLLDTSIPNGSYSFYYKVAGYVAKYSSAGAKKWLQKFGNTYTPVGASCLVLDKYDYPYIIGTHSAATYIPDTILPKPDSSNIYIVKLDTAKAKVLLAITAGINHATYGNSISLDPSGGNGMAIAGTFSTSTQLGSISLSVPDTALSSPNPFVARLSYEACILNSNFAYTGADTIHFKFTGALPADSIRWNFGDGTTSNSITPMHIYTDTGMYHVCVSEYASCGDTTFCRDIKVTKPLGLQALSLSNAMWSVYPTPATDHIFVSVAKPGTYDVMLSDMTGRILLKGVIINYKFEFNISSLSAGVYFISIKNENNVEVKKFVKD